MFTGSMMAGSMDMGGKLATAYCLGSILGQWPMGLPNATRLRQLAMCVFDSNHNKSYQRKCLIAIERHAMFLLVEGVKLKKPGEAQQGPDRSDQFIAMLHKHPAA